MSNKLKIDPQQLGRIANRFCDLQETLGGASRLDRLDREQCTRMAICVHHAREPLNFDVLEKFSDVDFSHDVGGMYRRDEWMSARSAMTYHKAA